MKFFNWVHKRFNNHHPIQNDNEYAQEARNTNFAAKTSSKQVAVQITNDKDTLALLETTVLDALDGWKDGILSIGTFGFDPLKPFGNSQKEYIVLESKDDDDDDLISPEDGRDTDNSDGEETDSLISEEEEVNPLMLSTLRHSFSDEDIAMLWARNEAIFEDQSDKKKDQRTTLADLFMADATVKMKLDNAKKKSARTKKTLSFAKKLIPKVKDETKNIQRLMKKMLNRKIHPELLDCKSQTFDGPMAAIAAQLTANGTNSASESASLLAI